MMPTEPAIVEMRSVIDALAGVPLKITFGGVIRDYPVRPYGYAMAWGRRLTVALEQEKQRRESGQFGLSESLDSIEAATNLIFDYLGIIEEERGPLRDSAYKAEIMAALQQIVGAVFL